MATSATHESTASTSVDSHTSVHGIPVSLSGHEYIIPNYIGGSIVVAFIVAIFGVIIRNFPSSRIAVGFELLYEKMYEFYREILGSHAPWNLQFIVAVFFIILFANLSALAIDIIAGFFPTVEHYVKAPTAEQTFTLGLGLLGILTVLGLQIKTIGFGHFLYEIIPYKGKNLLEFDKSSVKGIGGTLMYGLVKIADIFLSVFIGLLEMVVGTAAKIISLGFRLFGNITAGTILAVMAVGAINGMTHQLTGHNIPLLLPILPYLQGLLVSFIQAFVFALLIAVFSKVASSH